MILTNYIIDKLQRAFLIGFEVFNLVNEDNFSIGFANQESRLIIMNVTIRNDSRLKINLQMGTFGGELVKLMGCATSQRKKLFLEVWKEESNKALTEINVNINNNLVAIDKFLEIDSKWNNFSVNLHSFPFYEPDDNNRTDVIADHIISLWNMALCLIPYTIEGEPEGTAYEKTISTHERNPINRRLCIQFKGYECAVCGMKFDDVYGKIGNKFIEIHHATMVADMGENYRPDILEELFPVCSNCHSMLHRKRPPYTIEQLKKIIKENKSNSCF